MTPIITVLTDFGTADGYVGEMKGVLVTRAPGARIIDISHDIGAQDVDGARLALARYWRRFPEGTVHLVVVDPGVGSARAAIAVASDGRMLVGPDNGVLSPALLVAGARVVALAVPHHAAPTFHGRDLFAPVAGALASGVPIDELGTAVDDAVVRRTPEARRMDDGAIAGEIIAVDRFGNLLTNLVAPRGGTVEIASRAIPLARVYADVDAGALTALVGSSGLVEVAVRDGNAALTLDVRRGAPVLLRPPRP
jgi:S-adenosylmethionine hydrolase